MDELKECLSKVLSDDEINKLIESFSRESVSSLRVNTLKMSNEEFNSIYSFANHPYVNEGRIYKKEEYPMGKNALHNAGAYYIQEPSAMMVVDLLDVNEDSVVLDLCAAPGGKTTHLAAKMNNKGLIVANEISNTRVKALSENVERMGIRNCVVTNEDSYLFANRFEGYFTHVVLDAPCSGLGMVRKNEKSKEDWSIDKVNGLIDIQKELIMNAYLCLREGGILSYSTCTFTKEENEDIIQYLLDNTNASIIPINHDDTIVDGFIDGTIRLYPHKFNGEGHFIAHIKCNDEHSHRRIKEEKQKDNTNIKIYRAWEEENLNVKLEGKFIGFKDNLSIIDYPLFELEGIRVARVGIHLGEIIKGRFSPSHSLAVSLKREEIKRTVDYTVDSKEIKDYLNGQTLPSAMKGYVGVCCNGVTLGWGKASDGIIKNLYPKGLRVQ